MTQIRSDQDFGNVARIVNLPDGASDQEPATVAQLNAAIEGVKNKDPVRVATTSNINLSSAPASIDGVTLSTNDRVLVMNQTTASQNGIYIFNGAASAMTRAAEASTIAELANALVPVVEGTSANLTFRQTATSGTIGSVDVVFIQYGTSVPDAAEGTKGKIAIATQATVNTGTNDTEALTPLKAKSAAWMIRKHADDIGDGTNTTYTVTHNLDSLDVSVSLFRNANGEEVIADIERTDADNVEISFAAAPTNNEIRVVVIG